MALNSFFDNAPSASESSEVSSVEGSTDPQTYETFVSEHPRLSELKKRARIAAESQHKVVEDRKLRKGKDNRGKISKSRRQSSNIRSAEICRAAKGIYIEQLENEIQQEEEAYLQMWKEMLDQVTENTRVLHRLTYLEELCNKKQAQKSWTNMYRAENTVPDEVVDDFFPVPDSDGAHSQWDHRRDGYSNAYDGDIELCHWNEGEWMDFDEVNAPVTPPPPPPVKVNIPVTPKTENQCCIHYDDEKILLSPVTIADDGQEHEEELCGLML